MDVAFEAGRAQSTGHAAVWIPDTEVNKCMHCQKTQFTMINRRHHCRNCGNVICGNCSKNKFLIPSQSKAPVRVCDTCFEDLGTARINYAPKTERDILENPPISDSSTAPIYDEPVITKQNGPSNETENESRGMSNTEESSDEEESPKSAGQSSGNAVTPEIDSKVTKLVVSHV